MIVQFTQLFQLVLMKFCPSSSLSFNNSCRKMGFLKPTIIGGVRDNHFVVVHPLDDRAEKKVDTSRLGPMPMTTSVKVSLMALRGYLILMMSVAKFYENLYEPFMSSVMR